MSDLYDTYPPVEISDLGQMPGHTTCDEVALARWKLEYCSPPTFAFQADALKTQYENLVMEH